MFQHRRRLQRLLDAARADATRTRYANRRLAADALTLQQQLTVADATAEARGTALTNLADQDARLRSTLTQLADRWSEMADQWDATTIADQLGQVGLAARIERIRALRQSAENLRHVLDTGAIPAGLRLRSGKAAG